MKNFLVLAAVGMACIVQPPSCPAPTYWKLGDIAGEVIAPDYKDWILIQSISTPVFRGDGSSTVTFEDIVVAKELDKSSPKLMEACAKGIKIADATIVFTKLVEGTQKPHIEVKLTDVLVSSYSFGPESPLDPKEMDPPAEDFSLNFEEIKMSYGGIRKTVILYDEKGEEKERVTVGLVARPGGVIPPGDDVPPGETSVDSMTISANEAEAVEQTMASEVAG